MQRTTMTQIVERFYPRVRSIVRRLARRLPSTVDPEDLVQAGMTGLVAAVRSYDVARGSAMDAYLITCARGAILEELRALDPLSRDDRKAARGLAAARCQLTAELGRPPDDVELAARAELTVERVRELQVRLAAVATSAMETPAVAKVGAKSDEGEVLDQLVRRRTAERVEKAIAKLAPRLRTVLELRYDHELSLKEIGSQLGVSESRVCQLHGQAVAQLRLAA